MPPLAPGRDMTRIIQLIAAEKFALTGDTEVPPADDAPT